MNQQDGARPQAEDINFSMAAHSHTPINGTEREGLLQDGQCKVKNAKLLPFLLDWTQELEISIKNGPGTEEGGSLSDKGSGFCGLGGPWF